MQCRLRIHGDKAYLTAYTQSVLSPLVVQVLTALTSDPENEVWIISGRGQKELDGWFSGVVRQGGWQHLRWRMPQQHGMSAICTSKGLACAPMSDAAQPDAAYPAWRLGVCVQAGALATLHPS
jgi:hypothetical protein